MGVISPEGKCHSFDAEANGYMRSEGSFVFAIKPLAAAERDGDPIYAVIEATAVERGGDGGRHSSVSHRAASSAHPRVTPRSADARGLRAPVPVVLHANSTTSRHTRPEPRSATPSKATPSRRPLADFEREVPLRVSSVKSNVGHMEAAAFHCALLKVVLMMQSAHFRADVEELPDALIRRSTSTACPMRVQTELEPFPEHPVVIGYQLVRLRRRQRALRGARVQTRRDPGFGRCPWRPKRAS